MRTTTLRGTGLPTLAAAAVLALALAGCGDDTATSEEPAEAEMTEESMDDEMSTESMDDEMDEATEDMDG